MTTHHTLRLGTFDVERRWRPDDLAVLPTVRDPAGDRAAAAMDELLAVTCEPGDVLITDADVPDLFLKLFHDLGVEFTHRVAPRGLADPAPSIERRLLDAPPGDLRGYAFTPYSVVPETAQLVNAYGLRSDLPSVETVREVSSKTWSNALVQKLGLFGHGVAVDSVPRLLEVAAGFGDAPILLKDPYGVGGRGILELSSSRMLSTVCRVLTKQVKAGAAVELLVQPRFDRAIDFSAQFHVEAEGRVRWNGVLVIENVGFSHIGVHPPGHALQTRLADAGYTSIMGEVGAALAAAGYHGPVCVDSMLLRDGTLVPLLEINPRMSVGLISILAARRLAGSQTNARLAVRTVRSADPGRTFEAVVDLMRKRGVILTPAGTGLLPLAANTLQTSRGRLNCLIAARDPEQDQQLGAELDRIIHEISDMTLEAGHAP